MGREDHGIAALDALFAHPVFHDLANDGALGMPEDEAGTGELLNAEEVELLAEEAMVALGRFFKARKVGVEILLREEGGAVDALELGVFLVAEPVGSGKAGDLDGFDAAGGGHVGSAAEVDEFAVAIEADLGAGLGELGDEVGLHEVAVPLKAGEGLFARLSYLANEWLVARDDFGHLFLDGVEVVGGEGLFAIEVVEETGIGSGAVAELGFREKLEDRRGHDVGGGVAHDFESLGVVFLDQLKARVGGERRGEVDEARGGGVFRGVHGGLGLSLGGVAGLVGGAVDGGEPGDNGSGGEARRDGVGDVERRCAGRHFANGPVGQMYGDVLIAHDFRGRGWREN